MVSFPTQHFNKVEKDLQETFEKVALEDHDVTQVAVEDARDDVQHVRDNHNESRSSNIERFPIKTISLQREDRGAIFGYVQLCYDQRQETIIPMLEVSGQRRGKRISWMTPDAFPPLSRATISPTHSLGTISTLTAPEGLLYSSDEEEDSNFEPIVLGEDLQMYLLNESTYPHHTRTVGCSDVFRKLPKMFRFKRTRREATIKRATKRFAAAYFPMAA